MERKEEEPVCGCDSHHSFVREFVYQNRWLVEEMRMGKKPAGVMKLEGVRGKRWMKPNTGFRFHNSIIT